MTPIRAHSFDVFDTCVSRGYAKPRDLFFQLGLNLSDATASKLHREQLARAFLKARIRAEKQANRALGHLKSAPLKDIYARLILPTGISQTAAQVMDQELALEAQAIYPLSAAHALIERSRSEGMRIIFISDMYLPAAFIRDLLRRHKLLEPADTLYVSSDNGETKRSGQLFRDVLQREELAPPQLLHTGDDSVSDIAMAAALGIHTRHLAATIEPSHRLMRKLPVAAQISLASRKALSRSMISALGRRVQLDALEPAQLMQPLTPRTEALNVFAPFLTSFVLWLMQEAKSRGIGRLYFVARDGEIMYRIARELAAGDDSLDLRLLLGSRKAWLAPSIDIDDPTWHKLAVTPGQRNAPSDILERLGIAPADAASVLERMEDQVAGIQSLYGHNFLQALLASSECFAMLGQVIAEKRSAAVRYFAQEGLFEPSIEWALVDAGWSLNCQSALKRILLLAQRGPATVRGFYIGFAKDRLDEARTGPAFAFTATGAIFSRRRVVVEHCMTPSLLASTEGYAIAADGQSIPVFSSARHGEFTQRFVRETHTQIVAYARLVAADPQLICLHLDDAALITRQACAFLEHPSRETAARMSALNIHADMRHNDQLMRPLCREIDYPGLLAILRGLFSAKQQMTETGALWLEGSAALSRPLIRFAIASMITVDKLRQYLIRSKRSHK